MKKTKFLILILLLVVSCFQMNNDEFTVGNLWKITSINGTESYIFGTIHLYPKGELELSEKVLLKLKKCNILALERDVTNKSEQKKFMDFEMPKFFTESYQVVITEYGNELVGMENQLIEVARDQGIKITGLESTEEILHIMIDLNQIEIPQTHFEKDKMLQVYRQSLEMYKREQIKIFKDSLYEQIPKRITELTVDQRNVNWFGNIVNLIEKEPTFIAVGMGHLGGRSGLLNLLAQKGYKLNRVKI
ncbi:TraB/GumN family protein [Ascidiimonas aurantiaca]|uniref:TraB/GumN family protein n=1 Tax=Ascidiimonas aurantiaca TaxID=1685432 RepID=UPI0030EB12C8